MNPQARRILPPGIEDDIAFGIIWIRIGSLKLLRPTKITPAVSIQFWGEPTPAILEVQSQTLNNAQQRLQEYEIRCPIIFFEKYLQDMKHNLKIQVQNVGHVKLDISKFIKNQQKNALLHHRIQISDKNIFDHFKEYFEILGKTGKKVGSLEIEMSSNFNPEIAIRELQLDSQNRQTQNCITRSKNCPLTTDKKLQNCQCKGQCFCHLEKIVALDVLAVEKPELFQEFYQEAVQQKAHKIQKSPNKLENSLLKNQDIRIPNSLNLKVADDKQFNPQKYFQDPSQKLHENNIRNPKNLIKQSSSPSSANKLQNNKIQAKKQFPAVQKILTYSNLKLNYKESDEQNSIKSNDKQKQKQQISRPIQSKKQSIKSVNLQKQQPKKQPIENIFPVSFHEIEVKRSDKNVLFKQFYGENTPLKPQHLKQDQQQKLKFSKVSQISEIEKSQNMSMPRDILSRVVNLDKQLIKQRRLSPNKQLRIDSIQNLDVNALNLKKNNLQKDLNELHLLERKTPTKDLLLLDRPPFNAFDRPAFNAIDRPALNAFDRPAFNAIDRPALNNTKNSFRKSKTSTLLLNFIVEIQCASIKLGSSEVVGKDRFVIVHRPYGQKQRIKLGPILSKKITIMCPIGESEIHLMATMPFIIQFWNSLTNSFIGIISLKLQKINKGFLLEGRMNQIAIKTNIMPTIIHHGKAQINDLTQQHIGQCDLYAAIGTTLQIQNHINSAQYQKFNHNTVHQPVQKEKLSYSNNQLQKKQEGKMKIIHQEVLKKDQKYKVSDLTNFLSFIDLNNQKLIVDLLSFIKKPQATPYEFKQFLIKLNYSEKNVFNLLSANEKVLSSEILSNIFKEYVEIKNQTKEELVNVIKNISKNYNSKLQKIEKDIKNQKQFTVITKHKCREVLKIHSIHQSFLEIQNLLNYFDQLINAQAFIYLIKTGDSMEILKEIKIETCTRFFEKIQEKFIKHCRRKNISAEFILQSFKENSKISVHELDQLFKKHGLQIFIWQNYIIFDRIKQFFEVDPEQMNIKQIQLSLLYNWLNIKYEQLENKNEQSFQIDEKQLNSNQKQKNDLKIISKEDRFIERMPQNKLKEGNSASNKDDLLKKQETGQKVINNSDRDEEEEKIVEENVLPVLPSEEGWKHEQMYEHTFSITPLQVCLESDLMGQCFLSYKFPREDEQIHSKKMILLKDKHRYKVMPSVSSHKFTTHQPITDYFYDTSIQFKLRTKNQLHFQGHLHSDQLFLQDGDSQIKVLPIFPENHPSSSISGKIKLQLSYQVRSTNKEFEEKECVYNIFLQKNGYINFKMETQLDFSRIKNQFKIKDQFFVYLKIDFFNENSKIKEKFETKQSKLINADQSNSQSLIINLNGSLKIALNNNILEYIKTKSCLISLFAVYYERKTANLQKKQQILGQTHIPLMNLLVKEQGIQGNYALKSKLGMFVSLLAINEMKYEKQCKIYEEVVQIESPMKHKENYWILIDFLEVTNFQQKSLQSIKFQFLTQGKKYSTEKCILNNESSEFNLLSNQKIYVQLSVDQFVNKKVIPINVILNHHQKYAMDLSLKLISKELQRNKYCIKSQNIIVVDRHNLLQKMRVGIKITLLRGRTNIIANFVQSLRLYANHDSYEKINFIQNINSYSELLQQFRSMLKISEKTFEDIQSQLVGSKKQKLNYQFFTNKINFALDLTPILCESSAEIDDLCDNLPSIISKEELLYYLNENNIKLINFKAQMLDRFTFKELNQEKIDKNVQFLNINQHDIDLISLIQKLQVEEQYQEGSKTFLMENNRSNLHSRTNMSHLNNNNKQLRIFLRKGCDFNYLYNGIKPNIRIKIPALNIQTQCQERVSSHVFDLEILKVEQFDVQKAEQLKQLERMRVEVYHLIRSTNKEQSGEESEIIIGEGEVHFGQNMFNKLAQEEGRYGQEYKKTYQVVVRSLMNANGNYAANKKMQATLQFQLTLSSQLIQEKSREHLPKPNKRKSDLLGEEELSHDDSRIEQLMRKIKHEDIAQKMDLFESSDDD